MVGRRRYAAVGAVGMLACCVAAGPVPCQGSADVGSATVQTTGDPTALNPLAPCDVNGQRAAETRGAAIPGVVTFGQGTTHCGYDPATRTSTMSAGGHDVTLSALVPYGGPEIGFSAFDVTCGGGPDHSTARFSLGPYRGVTLPPRLPAGHTVTVPGAVPGAPPLARLVFGELTQPPIPDGSLRFTAVHITLFPAGGPDHGDIYVGSVWCTPTY